MVYGRDLGRVDVGDVCCIATSRPVNVMDVRLGLLQSCRQFRELRAPTGPQQLAGRQLGGFLGDPIMVISSALSVF